MTANQISYAKVLEDQRHNKEQERQKDVELVTAQKQADASVRQAEIAALAQGETGRHNLEQERINWWSAQYPLYESTRHNREVERIQSLTAQADADYKRKQTSLLERGMTATETSALGALMRGQSGLSSAQAALLQAGVAQLNAETRLAELGEVFRHNTVVESETQRHNTVGESLTKFQNRTGRISAYAQKSQAESAASQAKSSRIKAISGAVETGANVVSKISSLAAAFMK